MNPTINDSPANKQRSLDDRTIIQPDISSKWSSTGNRLKNSTPSPLLGDHSVSDPPDPISNSAVKPVSANGTNAQALEE